MLLRNHLEHQSTWHRYVDFDLATKTAAEIQGIRQFVTNEYMHSGIRDDGGRIFDTLLAMARGSIPLF